MEEFLVGTYIGKHGLFKKKKKPSKNIKSWQLIKFFLLQGWLHIAI